MKSVLDDAHTWFFERQTLHYLDTLVVDLVEGLKATHREYVEVTDEQKIGPFFPVRVTSDSRTASVVFRDVLAHQSVLESYSAPQKDFEADRGVVRRCTSLEYLNYIVGDSLIATRGPDQYHAYYVWTEDQTIFVVSESEPEIAFSDRSPNLTIERYDSYSSE